MVRKRTGGSLVLQNSFGKQVMRHITAVKKIPNEVNTGQSPSVYPPDISVEESRDSATEATEPLHNSLQIDSDPAHGQERNVCTFIQEQNLQHDAPVSTRLSSLPRRSPRSNVSLPPSKLML